MQSSELREKILTENHVHQVAAGVFSMRTVFVNVHFVENLSEPGNWVLVDAGLKGFAGKIVEVAEALFGEGTQPTGIVLTHGHFDHVGSLDGLLSAWDVPVYAHPLEVPYLTGQSSYPPTDPTVGGGLMSLMSGVYPRGPIDIGEYLYTLPVDGSIPGMPQWQYIHTPGHAPGHISLFREEDGCLISGDAFVTTRAESALSIMAQKQEVNGPPSYFTIDWEAAWNSVLKLAALEPFYVTTGHGLPMSGPVMQAQLHLLADHFRELAVPTHGRYVDEAAETDEQGVISVPPAVPNPLVNVAVGIGTLILTGALTFLLLKNARNDD